jgi:hypothetical protein
MSSAVQPSPTAAASLQHARLLATYPVDMFKALEPFMPSLVDCKNILPHPNDPVAINDQLLTIYTALGHARKAVEDSLPSKMLEIGGGHIFFSSTQQQHQGDWIKSLFDAMVAIENRIRDYFRTPTDPVTLLNGVIRSETPSLPSLDSFFREYERFNLLSGELAPEADSTNTRLYQPDTTVQSAVRLGLRPIVMA